VTSLAVLLLWFTPPVQDFTPPTTTAGAQRLLERRALQYFLDQTHPETGLVYDRARNFDRDGDGVYDKASIAATGFGIAVFANAYERGMLPRARAYGSILRALRFVSHMRHRRGWLYHFIDPPTGNCIFCEFSTIDTAIFIAGALYAGQVFHGEIERRANALYERIDFADMMTNGGAYPDKRTLSMGWRMNKGGYLKAQWNAYAEHILLLILGLGHPTHPLPAETWQAWDRLPKRQADATTIMGADLPLFAHQYSQLFVDLRDFNDGHGNYFTNGVRATELNRGLCHKLAAEHPTYRSGLWGISASDAPKGYAGYTLGIQDGTVCPSCAAASAMYDPQVVLTDLLSWMRSPLAPRLLGRYGFTDAVNLDKDWVGADVIGITEGALFLGLANMSDSTSVWRHMNRIPAIHAGLARARAAAGPPAAEVVGGLPATGPIGGADATVPAGGPPATETPNGPPATEAAGPARP
jgi:hypothetical protein